MIRILVLTALIFPRSEVVAEDIVALEVQNLQVPSLIRSGESIKVAGIIVNTGNSPILNLKLGVAVALADGSQKDWEVLEKNPQDAIAILNPGEQVIFSSKVRLEGDGWFQIGIVGTADNTFLSPQAKTVRVIDSSSFALQTMLVLSFYLLLLGIGTASLWYIYKSTQGWKRGILVAPILYLLLGIIWVSLFNAGLSGGEKPIIQTFEPLSISLLIIAWPLQIAQFFGLFGLGFG